MLTGYEKAELQHIEAKSSNIRDIVEYLSIVNSAISEVDKNHIDLCVQLCKGHAWIFDHIKEDIDMISKIASELPTFKE